MNSFKAGAKDGASKEDISAGLSSIIKNAVYKVIRAKSIDELGKNIVVQGGMFSTTLCLCHLKWSLAENVIRPAIAGLMGAVSAVRFCKRKSQGSGDGKSGVLTKAQLEESLTIQEPVQRGCGAQFS